MGNAIKAVLGAALMALLLGACDSNPAAPTETLPRQFESAHFVYHFAEGDRVDAVWQEGYVTWLKAALDVSISEKLHYHKYRDRAHLQRVTGNNGNGFADSKALSFHTIWPIDNHESVHVVVFNTIGRAPALFDEGIAVAHQVDPSQPNDDPRWSGQSVHVLARDYWHSGAALELDALLESASFRQFDSNITYPLSGSFVRFLIDQSGIEPMKRFTARSTPDDRSASVRSRFLESYGTSIEQSWTQWRAFLDEIE